MAKEVKQLKHCSRWPNCENMLPFHSDKDLCARCRAHDKKVSGRDPSWTRNRINCVARWTATYVEHLPKKERANVVIEYVPISHTRDNVTPIRKRA